MALVASKPGAKRSLVLDAVEGLPGEFALADVAARCPTVSKTYIRNLLRELRDDGQLQTTAKGRGARWRKTGS